MECTLYWQKNTLICSLDFPIYRKGAKKTNFQAAKMIHLTRSLKVILTSPKKFNLLQYFCNLNFLNNFVKKLWILPVDFVLHLSVREVTDRFH